MKPTQQADFQNTSVEAAGIVYAPSVTGGFKVPQKYLPYGELAVGLRVKYAEEYYSKYTMNVNQATDEVTAVQSGHALRCYNMEAVEVDEQWLATGYVHACCAEKPQFEFYHQTECMYLILEATTPATSCASTACPELLRGAGRDDVGGNCAGGD